MKKTLVRAGLAMALAGGAALAQAGTVDITGWTFGTGSNVAVTGPGVSDAGPAGGLTATISGFGALDSTSFATYCVDLAQDFDFNVTQGGYTLIAGSADTGSFTSGGWGSNAAATATRLGQLFTYVNANPTSVDTAFESTALQLAIWNIIYDTDNTLASGAFSAGASTVATYGAAANAFLSASLNTPSNLYVYVLQNAAKQDFVVTTAVPEPSTYALMLAGLGGVGFMARRRAKR